MRSSLLALQLQLQLVFLSRNAAPVAASMPGFLRGFFSASPPQDEGGGIALADAGDAGGAVDPGAVLPAEGRRLLPLTGALRTLIVRTTDSNAVEPFSFANEESDVWFGTHDLEIGGALEDGGRRTGRLQNSVSSLFDQCSGGEFTLVPAVGPGVVDGVLELTMDEPLMGLGMSFETVGTRIRDKFEQVNEDLRIQYDNIAYIYPRDTGGLGGLAGQGGNHQWYGGEADKILEVIVHEMGHTMVLDHSGLRSQDADKVAPQKANAGNDEYEDNSCMMGCCAGGDGAQQMCFNAAKSWYLGWYSKPGKEGHEEINLFRSPIWSGKLVGIDDYVNGLFDQNEHRVVVRLEGRGLNVHGGKKHFFMMFNRKKGINKGVFDFADTVVFVQQDGPGRPPSLPGRKSLVVGTLDVNGDNGSFTLSETNPDWVDYFGFDIRVKLCNSFYAPVVTGAQILGGVASQSSTLESDVHGTRGALLAVDGDTQSRFGSSTEVENNPWWMLTFDSPQSVEHLRLYDVDVGCKANCLAHDECGGFDVQHSPFICSFYRRAPIVLRSAPGKSCYEKPANDGEEWTVTPEHECATGGIHVWADGSRSGWRERIGFEKYHLHNAFVELFNSADERIFRQNLGTAVGDVNEFSLGKPYHDVTKIKIRLTGEGLQLALREVQPFGPSGSSLLPDYAHVMAYIPDGTTEYECGDTAAPTISSAPSSAPTINFVPSIPDGVSLRIRSECLRETSNLFRFNCAIEQTSSNRHSGDPVVLRGADGCLIELTPYHWAHGGRSFYFTSDESTEEVLNCFTPGTLLIEQNPNHLVPAPNDGPVPPPVSGPTTSAPTKSPTTSPIVAPAFVSAVPEEVTLEIASPCEFQENAERYLCLVNSESTPINIGREPGNSPGVAPVMLRGEDGCLVQVIAWHWAWRGTQFYFRSDEDLDTIQACFTPGTVLVESEPSLATPAPTKSPTTPAPTKSPTTSPIVAPTFVSAVPEEVTLEIATPCEFQEGAGRYLCRVNSQSTPNHIGRQPGNSPGVAPVMLRGEDGCLVQIIPWHWAWTGTQFYFRSDENLDTIQACFTPGMVLVESEPSLATPEPTKSPSTSPTTGPTAGPTAGPTMGPSTGPTAGPTAGPSTGPSTGPTAGPTAGPSCGDIRLPVQEGEHCGICLDSNDIQYEGIMFWRVADSDTCLSRCPASNAFVGFEYGPDFNGRMHVCTCRYEAVHTFSPSGVGPVASGNGDTRLACRTRYANDAALESAASVTEMSPEEFLNWSNGILAGNFEDDMIVANPKNLIDYAVSLRVIEIDG